jgi:hypothetical protein
MPWTAIHQSDQLKSAMSNGRPPLRRRSEEPTWNVTLLIPSEAVSCLATATFAGSGSMATTLEASGATCRVSVPEGG